MDVPQPTCLAIADISGYTRYLSGVELSHAQDVLADLLNAVVTPLRPPFHVAKLEGDAVFLFAPIDEMDGSVLLDLAEASYLSFRRRLRTIAQASSCECDACGRVPSLDLKLIVHHGPVLHHEVLGSRELVGHDVVVLHRLLKNQIVERHGVSAYVFLSDTCIEAASLDPSELALVRHVEDYDDVGRVAGWVHDLHRVWSRAEDVSRIRVDTAAALYSTEISVPGVEPALAWEWLTTPARKIQWEIGFDEIYETPLDGRRGAGALTHCVHGDDTINMEILDWNPPLYVTSRGVFPNGAPFLVTDAVTPTEDGVVVSKHIGAPDPDDEPAGLRDVLEMFAPLLDTWLPKLRELLELQLADAPEIAEPELPLPDEQRRLQTAISST